MATTNYERVGRVLGLLRQGLAPFVARECKARYGDGWVQRVARHGRADPTDTQFLLAVLIDEWREVFAKVLGHAERSYVSELVETRNRWAHQGTFSTDDAYRALDTVHRMLTSVAAADEALEADRLRQDLLRGRFAEQARQTQRRAAVAPIEGQPAGGLRPWRQLVHDPTVVWEETRVGGSDPLAVRAAKKLGNEESLITDYSGVRLRMDLDRVPLWRGDHVNLRQLWSDYSQYLYLPRLRDSAVLVGAVRDGVASLTWHPDTFAYASAFDEASGRYSGLVAAASPAVMLDEVSVVVRPDVAQHQIEEDRKRADDTSGAVGLGDAGPATGAGAPAGDATDERPVPPEHRLPVRFYGRITLEPVRMLRDVNDITDAIVRQLGRAPEAQVSVTVEIEATSAGGFDDDVRRTVTENARTLRFDTHEFESECW